MAKKKEPIKVFDKKTGEVKRLLRPNEKGGKAAAELKQGVHLTNWGKVKVDKNGKPKKLTDTQKSWRGGYLQARKDNAKCYNAIKRKLLNGKLSSKNSVSF